MIVSPGVRRAGRIVLLALPPLIVLAIGLDTVYGAALRSGFGRGPGDNGDSRIMLFLIESSWRSLLALRPLLSPPMFFPQRHVLGYTDAHLLWVPVFGALRSLGAGLVQSFTAMFALLTCFGLLCWWWLLRRALGLTSAAAAMGGFMFAFSNALTIKLGHGQMIGVTVLPLVLLLLHHGFAARRPLAAGLAGLLIGLLAATSYIVAWFFLFIAVVAGLIALAAVADFRRALRRLAVLRVLGATLLGLAIGLMPFAIIYGPMIATGEHRGIPDVAHFHPFLSDLIYLGDNHPVYAPLYARFGLPYSDPDTNAERFLGYSIPVWLLAIAGVTLLLRRRAASLGQRALLCAAAAAALVTALEFIYPGNVYPWTLVLDIVPGASAIRTTFRSQIDALLPVSALAAVALDAIWRIGSGGLRWRWIGVAGFLLLSWAAMLESVYDTASGGLSARDERALVAALPPPPAGCGAFGFAPQPPAGRQPWTMQSDALMLSLTWHLPTVNGNSSWVPPDWQLMNPTAPGYAHDLAAWVRSHGLAGRFCAFREDQRRWLDPAQLAQLLG